MINVSKEFRNAMIENGGRWLEYVDITIDDAKELHLTNENMWEGGINIEDAVSSDNTFEIGAAIINKCDLTINNIYDEFSEYDFGGARVVAYIGLELPDGTVERIRKGTYAVDEAKYNGSIIGLSCLDYMSKFDKLYSESHLTYPATLESIILNACVVCGVELNTYNFPRKNFVIENRPGDEATTFREIISWCAQIACCFCRCDVYGRLELKWYDQKALEKAYLDGGIFDKTDQNYYQSGDSADGGSFKPWDTGYEFDGGTFEDLKGVHHIYSNYSIRISTDDVVITGVRVVEKTEEESSGAVKIYQSGSDGYVVSVENNELIRGGAGNAISGWIGEQLIGFRFRKATVSHSSDPTIEAGDVAFLTDRKGNSYPIIVSSTKFSTGGAQSTTSAAEEPARNSAVRFSAETKNYVEYRKDLDKERTDREKALENLGKRIDESPGLFTTEEVQPNGGTIFYMHDKPSLADSGIVWKMTAEAWGVSTDGGKTYNAGMTVDGDTIVRILTAVGVNADWIKAGSMSADRISGGTLILGGLNNIKGSLEVLNEDGEGEGVWDNAGIYVKDGRIRSEMKSTKESVSLISGNIEVRHNEEKIFSLGPVTSFMEGGVYAGIKMRLYNQEQYKFLAWDADSYSDLSDGHVLLYANETFSRYSKGVLYTERNMNFTRHEIQDARINNLVSVNGHTPYSGEISLMSEDGAHDTTLIVEDGIIVGVK